MTTCTRCETALEDGDLRCAICALPVPDAARPADGAPRAQILRCGECGAAVGFAPEARAPRCGFCGATMAIEQPVDPVEAARLCLPFAVDRTAAEAALRGWLGTRGWFAPRALAGEAVLESLAPLSWAAWLVSAEARVAWAADSDAGAQRSAWAPHAGEASLAFRDIVVPASRGLRDVEARLLIPYYDLAPMVPVDENELGMSGEGTLRVDGDRAGAGPRDATRGGVDGPALPGQSGGAAGQGPRDATRGGVDGPALSGQSGGAAGEGPRDATRGGVNGPALPGQSAGPAGAGPRDATRGGVNAAALPLQRGRERPLLIERFDAQRSAARRHVHAAIEAAARVRIEPRIPGRRFRNVRVACLLERQTTERIALPAWILAYRYRGHPYRAIVHGQRAEVVFGRAPIDWSKVGWLVAIAAVIAATVTIWLAWR